MEGCRLASEASARPARRTQLTSAGQEAPLEPTTSFTPEDFVRACHAVAGAPTTPVSTPRPSGDANSDRSAMVNASGGKPEKAEDRRYKTLQGSLKKMAIELKEQRAEAQNQVTELSSDVKEILAAINGPAVGGVNAAPTQPPVRPVFEGHQPHQPRPPSSCSACGLLATCRVTVRMRALLSHCRAVVVEAGTRCLAVDAKHPLPLSTMEADRKACGESVCLSRSMVRSERLCWIQVVKSASSVLSSFALEPRFRPATFRCGRPTTVVCW